MPSKHTPQELAERALVYMESQGLRMTQQRRAIVQAAFNTEDHYTAEELLEKARQVDASVSRATVYRTLPLLVQTGLLRELDLGRDYKFYDPNYNNFPNHNHIICRDCDQIIEFQDYCLDVRESVVAHQMGFSPSKVRLTIEAECKEFHQTGYCPRRSASS